MGRKKNTDSPTPSTPESQAADAALADVNAQAKVAAEAKAKLDAAKQLAAEAAAAAKAAREALKEAKRAEREASGRKSWTRKLPSDHKGKLMSNIDIGRLGLHATTRELVQKFAAEYPEAIMDEVIQQGMSRVAALARAKAKRAAAATAESSGEES